MSNWYAVKIEAYSRGSAPPTATAPVGAAPDAGRAGVAAGAPATPAAASGQQCEQWNDPDRPWD